MATGIKDKVAIIGMGCTRFGERWDVGAEELMVEAFTECLEDTGIDKDESDDVSSLVHLAIVPWHGGLKIAVPHAIETRGKNLP